MAGAGIGGHRHLIAGDAALAQEILDGGDKGERHAAAPRFGDDIEIAHLGPPAELDAKFERDGSDPHARAIGFGDPDARLGFSYAMNKPHADVTVPTRARVIEALYEALVRS